MAKYLKNSKKKLWPIAAILVLVLAVSAACVLFPEMAGMPDATEGAASQQTQQESSGTGETTATRPQESQPAATEPTVSQLPALEYPLVLEDGKLVIDSLFQYDGINPDCGYEDGKNIASVMLRNVSGDYLEEAKIALTLTDGTAVNFTVSDLPAGKTVMAFDVANTAAEADAQCAAVSCEARWNSEIIPLPEEVSVSVEDVIVTVTNNTGRDLSELVVYCRCPLGEEYFGGVTYQYTINDLPANESATVEAWDCILGMAEVVRIAVTEE